MEIVEDGTVEGIVYRKDLSMLFIVTRTMILALMFTKFAVGCFEIVPDQDSLRHPLSPFQDQPQCRPDC